MQTVRVDIAYRPLRVAWALHSRDRSSLERAVRISNTAWGGCFNPIVFVDRPTEAKQLIEVFQADLVWPVGDLDEVRQFPRAYPHLGVPFYGDLLQKGAGRPALLDIHNAINHWHGTPAWKNLQEHRVHLYEWDSEDPLASALLMEFGGYPNADDVGIDYAKILGDAGLLAVERISRERPVPGFVFNHATISNLTRRGLVGRHMVPSFWKNYHGFFVGDASNVDDLVAFWNLRATDLMLLFVDLKNMPRYANLTARHVDDLRRRLERRHLSGREIAIWSRPEIIDEARLSLAGIETHSCPLDDALWNRVELRPPMMVMGEESALGLLTRRMDKPTLSFALKDKPFCGDTSFRSQHLVAAISINSGLQGDDHHTFHPPFVPELNQFVAETMYFHDKKVRTEFQRIGIVIDAAQHDVFLSGLPTAQLFEKTFELAGLHARLSGAGLITRQLLSRLGGVINARVFKIPGVRRLLKTYGPTASFTKNAALQLIGAKDPKNPEARFEDHDGLYIDARQIGSRLTPQMVFGYLVEKGLFRIGAALACPTCRLENWVALDVLKQHVTCELCGADFDATRQLVEGVYHYRRTGVLGLEKNTQGAVPVALVLEQLTRNLFGHFRPSIYVPSYDLRPMDGVDLPACELDFALIIPGTYPGRASVVLGECKDEGEIDEDDVENLRRIAEALPAHRFEAFIVFAKMTSFTEAEIAMAKSLNRHRKTVILLTPRELEAYSIFQGSDGEFPNNTAEDLAYNTSELYFEPLHRGEGQSAEV